MFAEIGSPGSGLSDRHWNLHRGSISGVRRSVASLPVPQNGKREGKRAPRARQMSAPRSQTHVNAYLLFFLDGFFFPLACERSDANSGLYFCGVFLSGNSFPSIEAIRFDVAICRIPRTRV